MALTLRNTKGSPLTHQELDDNFLHLSSSIAAISGSGGGVSGTYSNATGTPVDFPNSDNPSIAAGTTFVSKSFQEMMTLMLYPTLNPTLTAPSSTFTISPSGFREIGETIATVTLSATFNRGSINPAYGTDGFRSGLPNTYNYGGYGATNNSSTSLTNSTTISNHVVESGANSWSGSVSYDAGEQPLDSDGNDFGSPLSAGDTSEVTRTITGVYPVFATSVSIDTSTKQSLQSMSANIEVTVVAETGNGDKQTIEIPNDFDTITGVQLYNSFSGNFEIYALSNFTTSATTKTIQGNSVNYTKYTYNGPQAGERTYKFLV